MKLFALENGWTGGQFSFFRILFGIYLFIHFMDLIPFASEVFSSEGMLGNGLLSPIIHIFPNIFLLNDSPAFVQLITITGLIGSISIILGLKDKIAAFWVLYVLACLFGRNPLIANPALPYVGFMLLCLMFVPKAPFGSYEARGNDNVGRDWVMPKDVLMAAWLIMALTYSYSGYTKLLSPSWVEGNNISYVLNNPLARDYFFRDFLLWLPSMFLQLLTWSVLIIELLFAPLALFRKLRPFMWGLMAIIQLGFAFCLNFLDLTAAMLLFHIFTFDPAWIKGKASSAKMTLFYDGQCGFCHGVVRFLLAEDKKDLIHFSPLQGDHLKSQFSEEQIQNFPDSIVLVTEKGSIFLKSSAVAVMLVSLGGLWRPVGNILWLIPQPIRDFGYTCIGKIRKKLVSTPKGLCPLVTPELRKKFMN